MSKILVADDDPTLVERLEHSLIGEGHALRTCADGSKVVDVAYAYKPDLIVLDLILPGHDSFEVCRELRQNSSTSAVSRAPIFIISARADEIDKVLGLELDADDYLVKPFGIREFLARVKALLRRSALNGRADPERQILQSGGLVLDTATREATADGRRLSLSRLEFELLAYFIRYPSQLLSRQRLVRSVWGHEPTPGTDRTLDVHMRWLRSKIEPEPSRPTRIRTVRGSGFVFDG